MWNSIFLEAPKIRFLHINLPKAIENLLKDYLELFVYEASSCNPGCFCNPQGQSAVRQDTIDYKVTLIDKKKRASGYILKGANTREQVIENINNGTSLPTNDDTGKPLPVNPDVDEIWITAENCCGQVTLEMDILNWFEYEFDINAKMSFVDEIGECQSESEGVLVWC